MKDIRSEIEGFQQDLIWKNKKVPTPDISEYIFRMQREKNSP